MKYATLEAASKAKNPSIQQLEEGSVLETYSEEELDDMIGKVYNTQKIETIYRRKKYG